MYNPSGERIVHYRKSNLFDNDIPWAIPGHGFSTLALPPPLGRTTLAICNDLNPQKPAVWESLVDGPYELARHCISEGTQTLILLNAWLHPDSKRDSDDGDEPAVIEEDASVPQLQTVNYWAMRLRPLWVAPALTSDVESATANAGREVIVIVSNRFGSDGKFTFGGTSAAFSLKYGSDRPQALDLMGQREEGACLWNILRAT